MSAGLRVPAPVRSCLSMPVFTSTVSRTLALAGGLGKSGALSGHSECRHHFILAGVPHIGIWTVPASTTTPVTILPDADLT